MIKWLSGFAESCRAGTAPPAPRSRRSPPASPRSPWAARAPALRRPRLPRQGMARMFLGRSGSLHRVFVYSLKSQVIHLILGENF